jgi:hypothetical protein
VIFWLCEFLIVGKVSIVDGLLFSVKSFINNQSYKCSLPQIMYCFSNAGFLHVFAADSITSSESILDSSIILP